MKILVVLGGTSEMGIDGETGIAEGDREQFLVVC